MRRPVLRHCRDAIEVRGVGSLPSPGNPAQWISTVGNSNPTGQVLRVTARYNERGGLLMPAEDLRVNGTVTGHVIARTTRPLPPDMLRAHTTFICRDA
jgi:hypothetical protein